MDPLTRRHAKDQMKLFNRVRIRISQLVNPLTITPVSNTLDTLELTGITANSEPDASEVHNESIKMTS